MKKAERERGRRGRSHRRAFSSDMKDLLVAIARPTADVTKLCASLRIPCPAFESVALRRNIHRGAVA